MGTFSPPPPPKNPPFPPKNPPPPELPEGVEFPELPPVLDEEVPVAPVPVVSVSVEPVPAVPVPVPVVSVPVGTVPPISFVPFVAVFVGSVALPVVFAGAVSVAVVAVLFVFMLVLLTVVFVALPVAVFVVAPETSAVVDGDVALVPGELGKSPLIHGELLVEEEAEEELMIQSGAKQVDIKIILIICEIPTILLSILISARRTRKKG